MSLIDEALKRARADVGRPDASSQVTPVRWFPAPAAAARSSRRRALLTGLLAGGIGVAAVALVGVFLLNRSDRVPANAPATPVAAAPVPVPSQAVAPPSETPAAKPLRSWERARQESARQEAARQAAGHGRTPELPEATPPETRAAPAVEPTKPVAKPAAASSSRPVPEAVALEDGKTYSRSVALPDGGQLALSGIAYSETQPVAVLNGKVVGPGEIVSGFTVSRIEIDRVELKGRGVSIVLLLN